MWNDLIKLNSSKLKAFTLIEGIVSVVIISLILSAGVLISFNIYKSFPRHESQYMRHVLQQQLDSLTQRAITEKLSFQVDSYRLEYHSQNWNGKQYLFLASLSITDTLDNTLIKQTVFDKYDVQKD